MGPVNPLILVYVISIYSQKLIYFFHENSIENGKFSLESAFRFSLKYFVFNHKFN